MIKYDVTAPRLLARSAGMFILLTILGGLFAQGFVSDRLIAGNDGAVTALNILEHKLLFKWSFTVYLVEMACQIAATVFLYQLLKVVNRTAALLSLALELTGCVIKTFARVFYIAPLLVLSSAAVLKGFSAEQLQSLVLILLKMNARGAAIALAFFGFSTALHGYLIVRSTFLPRWLGVMALMSGFGWLTFLYPLGAPQFVIVASFALLCCAAMIFWLIVVGVDERRWREQAGVVEQ